MFWKRTKEKEGQFKALSEKEIQKQLYGKYLGKDDRRVEVMDSSAIVEQKEEHPIEEKYDAKFKKELSKELESLKVEFKHLKEEVNRLRKQKEALEHLGAGFKLPFLKTKYLVVIGSIVVILAIGVISIFAIRFTIAKVLIKKPKISETVTVPSKVYTIQAYTTTKSEDANNALRLLLSKGFTATAKEVKSSSGKTQFAIYVGEYLSKQQANATLQELRKEKQFRDSFVRTK